jgi:hypothetical protein
MGYDGDISYKFEHGHTKRDIKGRALYPNRERQSPVIVGDYHSGEKFIYWFG